MLLSPALHPHPRGQRILAGLLSTGLVCGLAGALWQHQSVTVLGIAIATGALVVLAPRVRRSRDALRGGGSSRGLVTHRTSSVRPASVTRYSLRPRGPTGNLAAAGS